MDQPAGWQLHRPDTDEGALYCFRRRECGLAGLVVPVRAVKPGTRYTVRFLPDTGKATVTTMSGKEMREGIVVRMPRPGSSIIVRYKPAAAGVGGKP